MNKKRCSWCEGDPIYEAYHDSEWGVPIKDDPSLFEYLILESFQAGLSWITILKKRPAFRKAFDNFDCRIMSQYKEEKLIALAQDKGIVRNKLKIKSAVQNACAFIKVQEEFGSFSQFYWAYTDSKPIKNKMRKNKDIPPFTELSRKISGDLKKRGFNFVGPTIVYAFMQATGMVNDHITTCFKY
jgi:DNA-3-methyladenine glycosylase I